MTPDPGVLEVNVHPARSWRELVDNTAVFYEEAAKVRLGTEKFMIDGRHTGTGGGNHLVLGGPTPADSPLLRRPDLLGSLASYWLNHPSLSYLFSGLFIGPTSQAPRVDEARHDSLYELEIALRQLAHSPAAAGETPALGGRSAVPQPVRRRHRQHPPHRDVHRQAVQPGQRQRAPGPARAARLRDAARRPHERGRPAAGAGADGLVLARALRPAAGALGHLARSTASCCPTTSPRTSATCMGDLSRAGFPFESGWFAPHFEFRFPVYGRVQVGGLELELRQALEPWHVMGEEPGAGAWCASSTPRSSGCRCGCGAQSASGTS